MFFRPSPLRDSAIVASSFSRQFGLPGGLRRCTAAGEKHMRLNLTPLAEVRAPTACRRPVSFDFRFAICDFPRRSPKLALGRRAGLDSAGEGLD